MKQITVSLFFSSLLFSSMAQTISPDEAISRAREFMNTNGVTVLRAPSRGGMQRTPVFEAIPSSQIISRDSMAMTPAGELQEAFYVVKSEQAGDGGYVIVSADKRMVPILGFSNSSHFNLDQVPCSVKAWLTNYATQLRNANTLTFSDGAPEQEVVSLKEIGEILPVIEEGLQPMLTTSWGQRAPYNNMCPNPKNYSSPCVTGCVATGMAQVLNYYKYPKQGIGTHEYTSSTWSQTFSADYGSTTYDWDNMLDQYESGQYTQAQADAVATLMYHCGVASHMGYGYSESGTSHFYIRRNCIDHFGYDKDIKASSGSSDQWYYWHNQLLFELNNHRPVLYMASNHCFILDGYKRYQGSDTPYYHMNMGWNGLYEDDYYLLTAFPDLRQSDLKSHYFISSFMPEDNLDLPWLNISTYKFNQRGYPTSITDDDYSLRHDDAGTIKLRLTIGKTNSELIDKTIEEPVPGILRLIAVNQDKEETQLYELALENTNQWTIAEVTEQIPIPQLPIGRYTLEWRIYTPTSGNKYNLCSGGYTKHFLKIYNQAPKLAVQTSEFPTIIDALDFNGSYTIRNDGTEHYYGNTLVRFTNTQGYKTEVESSHLNLAPGQQCVVNVSSTILDLVGGPATLTFHNGYDKAPLTDFDSQACNIDVDTRPIIPKVALWKLTPYSNSSNSTSPGIYMGMLLNTGDYDCPSEEIAAVAVDDDDNIISIIAKDKSSLRNLWESYHGWTMSGYSVGFSRVDGSLPNGEYKVRVAISQLNSGIWTLYKPDYKYFNMYLTMKLTDSEALLGTDEMGYTSFYRTKWAGAIKYKYFDINVKGRGTATFDYRKLHHGKNRCTAFVGNTAYLRLDPEEGTHYLVKLDGVDVTDQVNNRRLDIANIQGEHTIDVEFVYDLGDANLSTDYTIADLSTLVAIMKKQKEMTFSYINADLNKNGLIDEEDIALLTDMILNNHTYQQATAAVAMHQGRPYVDMAIPEYPNLRWATYNLGAENPTQSGMYYAWGEPYEKDEFFEGNYRWMPNGDGTQLLKYNTLESFGDVDNITRVEMADDPARQQWGGKWRMPTLEEFEALAAACNVKVTSGSNSKYNQKSGMIVTATNGNELFLISTKMPSSFVFAINTYGWYWTADLNTEYPNKAHYAKLSGNNIIYFNSDVRYDEMNIRPVFDISEK